MKVRRYKDAIQCDICHVTQRALIAAHEVKGANSDYNSIKRYRVILCRLCFVIAKLWYWHSHDYYIVLGF